MPVNDFLFEGRPPPSVTTYGETVESMPKWLSDYTQGLVSRANAISAEGYQPYGGPRIADFSEDELSAFAATRENQGVYEPYVGAGTDTLRGGLSQAYQQLGEGTRDFPGGVQAYMDPYIENVLNRNTSLSRRNLEENLIPGLQDMFTRSGHFGSDRMMELAGRTFRDVGENLNEQNLGALSQAYGQAGTLFGADRNRELQAAGISGELGIEGARGFGALGQMSSNLGFRDASALEAIGRQQRGMDQDSLSLAYQDFLQQRDYPRETIDWMSSVIRGLPYDQSQQTQKYGPIGNQYAPSGASQLASLFTAGAGLYDVFQGNSKGGLVQYAEGGLVIDLPSEDWEEL